MAVEITPEPTDDERQAILAALAAEGREPAGPTPWWRYGLEQEEAGEEPYATAPRRRQS